MALDHFDVTAFPSPLPPGVNGPVFVVAMDASGNIQTGYTGTVTFTSTDPLAVLPAPYTFTGGDAGIHVFLMQMGSVGSWTITVTDLGANKSGDDEVTVVAKPLGWGQDPYGITPYGGAEAGLGLSILSAVATATNQVLVQLNTQPLDQTPSGPGDALNPNTWTIQRLDTGAFLHPVDVEPESTTSFLITTLEQFAPYTVIHAVSSNTLLDTAGNLLVAPRSAQFAGLLAYDLSTNDRFAASKQVASRDIANPPFSVANQIGGTLIVTGQGDYANVSGVDLIKKLVFRRLTTTPGAFFHLPDYGVGINEKSPYSISDLTKLKANIENQIMREPEVSDVSASLSLDANNILSIDLNVILQPNGQQVTWTFPEPQAGAGS